ncbi:MAG: hypothetical protein ACI9LV_000273 [Candidatus Nanohaloarchaea archaeon]|jgi:hypothetical protein
MEYSLNLDGGALEDANEKMLNGEIPEPSEMPSRENPEEYSTHIYKTTFEDAGMEREPFRRVFEEFDQREEFSFDGENPVEALNNEVERRDEHPTDWQSYNSGDEVFIATEMPGVNGNLWSEYGPLSALDDAAVFSAPASIYVDVGGEKVVNSIASITEQTGAPYLESNPEAVQYEEGGDIFTGWFTVPPTYTEEKLEESVDAWVDRVSQVSELQEDLIEVMDRHP